MLSFLFYILYYFTPNFIGNSEPTQHIFSLSRKAEAMQQVNGIKTFYSPFLVYLSVISWLFAINACVSQNTGGLLSLR